MHSVRRGSFGLAFTNDGYPLVFTPLHLAMAVVLRSLQVQSSNHSADTAYGEDMAYVTMLGLWGKTAYQSHS